METILEYLGNLDWLTLIFVAVGGTLYYLFNEIEDECIKSTWNKFKNFLNTNLSWKNKWALGYNGMPLPYKKKFYHFGIYPIYKERFFYSSTIFVFVSDGEHIAQFLKNIFILVSIGFVAYSDITYWQAIIIFLSGRLLMSFVKEAFLKRLR